MTKVKVIFERQNCIGARTCCAVCPKFWKMSEDGKAELLKSKKNLKTGKYELDIKVSQNDLICLRTAKDSCPAQAIELVEGKE